MLEWYIARTQPRAEERAVWHLNNQGFEAYLPRYRKEIRHARRTEMVMRPLFPGYVFVLVNTKHQGLHVINSTIGVISLVQFGAMPRSISSSVVDGIRAREDSTGIINLSTNGLKKGDCVRVREGAFADCTALLDQVSDQKRVYLLLDLMGREVRVSVPMENLAKAS